MLTTFAWGRSRLAPVCRASGWLSCLATEVPDAIERLLRRYLDDRSSNENLRQFFARHNDIELREFWPVNWWQRLRAMPPRTSSARSGGIESRLWCCQCS